MKTPSRQVQGANSGLNQATYSRPASQSADPLVLQRRAAARYHPGGEVSTLASPVPICFTPF